jgi:hypothetical protein
VFKECGQSGARVGGVMSALVPLGNVW